MVSFQLINYINGHLTPLDSSYFGYQNFKIFNYITDATFLFHFDNQIIKSKHFGDVACIWSADSNMSCQQMLRFKGFVTKIKY